tara:strand:- start:4540 stop:5178 length:639 start_codon:yes stop_codon:yes gene_type:complete
MKNKEELLKLRKKIKKRKPKFIRQDAHKKKRVGNKWRKPKGLHSKIRLSKKGYRKKVTSGYGSPKLIKGYDKSGLIPIMISNIQKLNTIDAKIQGIIIKSGVGIKKKVAIIKKCKELSIKIINLKNPDKFVSNVEDKMNKRKEKKEKVKKQKDQKKKDREKFAKEKQEKEKENKTDTTKKGSTEDLAEKIEKEEETKKKAKQEKDKILTKKQ